MQKFKKAILGLFVAMFAVVALGSCNKDNDDTPVVSEKLATPSSEEIVARDLSKQAYSQLASSPQFYQAGWSYKIAYLHLKQYSRECSWTSYVLAATAVARGSWQGYPNNKSFPSVQDIRDKIQHVKNKSRSSYIL